MQPVKYISVIMPLKAIPMPVLSLYSGERLIGSVPYDMSKKGPEYLNERLAALKDKYSLFLSGFPKGVWFCIENVVSKASFIKVEAETLTA